MRLIGPKQKTLQVGALVVSAWLAGASLQVQAAPVVLLTPTIMEDFAESVSQSAAMEEGLLGVMEILEKQQEAYKAADCNDGTSDIACQQIKQQMNGAYSDMLSKMEEGLPELQNTLQRTAQGLQGQVLRLAKTNSVGQIQEMLAGSSSTRRTGSTSKRGLSKVLKSRLALIKRRTSTPGGQVAQTTALYLDMDESSELLTEMQAVIAEQKIELQIRGIYGQLTPEMEETIGAVQAIIFGDDVNAPDDIITDEEESLSAPKSAVSDLLF